MSNVTHPFALVGGVSFSTPPIEKPILYPAPTDSPDASFRQAGIRPALSGTAVSLGACGAIAGGATAGFCTAADGFGAEVGGGLIVGGAVALGSEYAGSLGVTGADWGMGDGLAAGGSFGGGWKVGSGGTSLTAGAA